MEIVFNDMYIHVQYICLLGRQLHAYIDCHLADSVPCTFSSMT